MKPFFIFTLIALISFGAITSCSKNNSFLKVPIDNPDSTDVSDSSHGDTTTHTDSTVVPDSVIQVRKIVYSNKIDWLGKNIPLIVDVYIPAKNGKPIADKIPLFVYLPGGGLEVCHTNQCVTFASLMARKGFVVAVVQYRAGWTHSKTDLCTGDSTQIVEALYRAMQDTRSALRFLVANAQTYFIDTNWIFLAGGSAGAIVTLGTAYYTQATADLYMPGLSAKLGPLDSDNTSYSIKGLVSMWGSLMTAPSLITSSNAKPTIFFHGMLDSIVPYDAGHFYLCNNFPLMYGTNPLYNRLTSLGVPAVAHIDPEDGHGVFDYAFRDDNIACFLRSIMNNHPERGFYLGWQSSCQ